MKTGKERNGQLDRLKPENCGFEGFFPLERGSGIRVKGAGGGKVWWEEYSCWPLISMVIALLTTS